MNRTVLGNKLTFKTFNYLKVNNTDIILPEELKKDYCLKSDEKEKIEEFNDAVYGVSRDSVKFNEEFGNLYKYYESKEGLEFNKELLLQTSDDYNSLFDTHDVISNENSQLNLILIYESKGEHEKYRNSIIRILAKENSLVNLYVVQNEGTDIISAESIYVKTENSAKVNIYQFQLGSKELYSNFQSDLRGEYSELNVDSIYFGHSNNKIDLLYNINHYSKNSKSDILVNGALKEGSFKTFKSNLDFKRGSSYSIGSEKEYTILLDDDVTSLSVPILLSGEDNVEGNHAASSGKIDLDLLFYIMSRGFSLEEAESLIIQSKFSHAIDKIGNEKLKNKIWERIMDIVRRK